MNEREHCNGKMCLSVKEAGQMINDAKRRNQSHHMKDIPKRKYLCKMCGFYHLTKQSVYHQDRIKKNYDNQGVNDDE